LIADNRTAELLFRQHQHLPNDGEVAII